MNRSELRLWLSGVLDGLDAKPELIDRVMKRIDQAYGSASATATATERDTDPSSPQYGEPVATQPPPPVKDVETKYPPRRKGSVAAAVVTTRTGDPLKAKYKPEDPEVLLME